MKTIKYPKLAQKLEELRIANSYKQEDVAAALEVVRQTYANYEQGIRTPNH
ncbi:MAG: helix-turn-helix domain-containing protein [Lachnospiraceae bacterium]|nr:helix-turn-helix domain-containing protein [Lachnospiraceae bacterium]